MALPTEPIILDPTGARAHDEHRRLRGRGLAVRVDILGVSAWSVADPALLKELLTSPAISKDARAHWPEFGDVVQRWPLALWVAVENMFTAYGADHRRLRRMIAPAFSHRRITALSESIDAVVTGILDRLEALPPGETVDLREHLAYPLPIAVVSRLMGVPEAQQDSFRRVVDGVFDTTLTTEESEANTKALYEALQLLIDAKRTEPGDDMTSLLITTRDEEAEGEAATLSEGELRDTLLLMISAGYETTVNVIDQAITQLLTHRDQLALLLSGEADWSDAVEETLRLEPAVRHLPMRFAVTDIDLPDGQTIPRGDAILASYAAANRHPDWHGESADAFDITRTVKDHLAFGHGVHFCLGAPLARLEVATALRLLFDRFPQLELAVPAAELLPLGSLLSNGHQSLPVRLRPAAR
ncbi:cytochrome P450 family protein [Streptomyces formicae]|uniref:Putative cytochrome P450 hydroxylase n=1 Tax=Streptomyces formicae TaxID=1616117 RepID=A0A291QNC6_9ACTN|nr:cytochrome P450 [Streptomyces formicae]ATL33088.1 putative cytochrome P450 hydroxylase [Streptomyces formicae]